MTKLNDKHCVPCESGTPPLDDGTIAPALGEVPKWSCHDEAGSPRLGRHFAFKDFMGAMAFLRHVAVIAEAEGHHPDFCVHYNEVDITLWTHDVHGLSENDFILAAKIDSITTAHDA